MAAFLAEIVEGGFVQKLLIISFYGFANDPQLSSDLLQEVVAQATMLGFPWTVFGDFQAPAHEMPAALILRTGAACNLDDAQAGFLPPRAPHESTGSISALVLGRCMLIGFYIVRVSATILPSAMISRTFVSHRLFACRRVLPFWSSLQNRSRNALTRLAFTKALLPLMMSRPCGSACRRPLRLHFAALQTGSLGIGLR